MSHQNNFRESYLDLLPNELIITIYEELTCISDKRSFTLFMDNSLLWRMYTMDFENILKHNSEKRSLVEDMQYEKKNSPDYLCLMIDVLGPSYLRDYEFKRALDEAISNDIPEVVMKIIKLIELSYNDEGDYEIKELHLFKVGKHKQTYLNMICMSSAVRTYKEFVKSYRTLINPGYIGHNGITALMYACGLDSSYMALDLIENFDQIQCNVGQVDEYGNTAFSVACGNNNMTDVAMVLINKFGSACHPEKIGNDYNTALIKACSTGNKELVFSIIEVLQSMPISTSIPGHVNGYGETALFVACFKGFPTFALKLIETYDKDCNPGAIADSKVNKMVLDLEKSGNVYNVNESPFYGNTALIASCRNNLLDVAEVLITRFGKLCRLKNRDKDGFKSIDHLRFALARETVEEQRTKIERLIELIK